MPIEDGIQEDRIKTQTQVHRDADVSYINDDEDRASTSRSI